MINLKKIERGEIKESSKRKQAGGTGAFLCRIFKLKDGQKKEKEKERTSSRYRMEREFRNSDEFKEIQKNEKIC